MNWGHHGRVDVALVAVALMAGAGCATLPAGERWGEQASFQVGWHRAADAALHAAKNPVVWAPLAGAAILQIDNLDHRVSDWAIDHTPVYGSTQSAHHASDDIQTAAGLGAVGSWLAIPDRGDWDAKLKGGTVEAGAILAESVVTETLKLSDRTRPNGGSHSFPSGHTAFVAVADTLTVRNLQAVPIGASARSALAIGADVMTIATAWARVEAGAHYPSDVLVGMAIGSFFGHMFTDAFLGDDLSRRLTISFQATWDGGVLAWDWAF